MRRDHEGAVLTLSEQRRQKWLDDRAVEMAFRFINQERSTRIGHKNISCHYCSGSLAI